MEVIAAVDKNWGIGAKGKLLLSIPEDMMFFRRMTIGNVVVMGRKTLASFPGGKPLKDRINIVLTSDMDYHVQGVKAVHSVLELLETVKGYAALKVFVIGGGEVYKLLLPYCDTAYITFMDYCFQADTYFPNLDREREWEIISESTPKTYSDVEYYFRTYKKR